MPNTYSIGTVVRSSVLFKDLAGVLTDPTTITLIYRDPTGADTTVTYAGAQVQRLSTGSYYYDILVQYAGLFQERWVGTGTLQAAGQDYFIVQPLNT